jgi:hypothetical protein
MKDVYKNSIYNIWKKYLTTLNQISFQGEESSIILNLYDELDSLYLKLVDHYKNFYNSFDHNFNEKRFKYLLDNLDKSFTIYFNPPLYRYDYETRYVYTADYFFTIGIGKLYVINHIDKILGMYTYM